MKKMLALLLALVMVLSLAACGNKGGDKPNTGGDDDKGKISKTFEQEKAEYAALTEEQLIAKYVKDPTAVTTDEYIALFSTLKFAEFIEKNGVFYLDWDNETTSALKTLEDNKALKNVDNKAAYTALIASEYPQVRGYAIKDIAISDYSEQLEVSRELLKNETDPYVLSEIIGSFCYQNITDSDVIEFINKMSTNESKFVRKAVAGLLLLLNPTTFDGIVDMLLALMNDSEQIVKEAALSSIGNYEDPKILDAVEAVLKDKAQYEYHEEALCGVYDMWYDYRFHKNASEKAYKISMEYYKTTVFDPDVKYKNAIGAMTNKQSIGLDEWKAKAPYYNPSEIAKIMVNVLVDPNVNISAKYDAVRAMEAHCSKAEFAANKAKVDSYTGDSADMLKERYQKAMDKAK